MKAKFATLVLVSALLSSPVMAQPPASAPAKPSLLARMKAATQAKTTAAKPVTAPVPKPMTAASNKVQGQRTAKSIACSTQADLKNVHGKARKSFMEHCKKA